MANERSNMSTAAVYPSLSEKIDDKGYLLFQRLKMMGSRNGGIVSYTQIRMAAGGYSFPENWKEQVSEIVRLEKAIRNSKKKSPEYKEAKSCLRLIKQHLREEKSFAGTRSTKAQIKNLKDMGLVTPSKHKDSGDYYVFSEKEIVEKLDVAPTKVSIDASSIHNSFPNGSRIKFNAIMTEVKLQFRHNGIKIGERVKSRVERDGSRSKRRVKRTIVRNKRAWGAEKSNQVLENNKGGVFPGVISTQSGAAKLVSKSTSTVRRHRKIQKVSHYNSGKIIRLRPGLNDVYVLGVKFNLEVPFDRHSQLMWKDEMNRSRQLGPYGKFIPYADGVAIQESSVLESTEVKVKKGSGYYKQKAEKLGMPIKSRKGALAAA